MGVAQVSITIGRFSGLWGISCWEIRFLTWLVRVLREEVIGLMPRERCFLEIFRAVMAHIGISSSWGSCYFASLLNARDPLGQIFQGKTVLDPSGEIQAYPFPRKINFPGFYRLLNLSWYQMGRGREVPFNSSKCLSALVKIFPCGRFKKFKQTKLY